MEKTQLFYTIISGVVVFIISQLFVEFLLRPIQEYKRLRGKVSYSLVRFACYYSNPQSFADLNNSPQWTDAANETRKLASEVAAFAEIKPHAIFVWYAIPRKKCLKAVSQCLIGLSNSYFEADECKDECLKATHKLVERIRRLMKIVE